MNKYVLTTSKGHYNTVTRVQLPLLATNLAEHCFLEGQEKEAIAQRLFAKPDFCNFEIIPTWECNLRCSHCSVLHQLKTVDQNVLNIDKAISFINKYYKAYETKLNLSFVGGEPLLKAKQLDELLKKLNLPATARITTNGVCDLNLSLLSKMTQITVSIDGNQIQHNTQRKSLLHDDPYEKTIANLKIMLKNFGKNVYVQAAVRDEFFTTDYKKSFYKTMLKLGVYKDNIIYGCIHPTKKKPDPQQMYLQSLKMVKLRDNPCCKFRYMRNFVIDSSNSVFGEFFNASQENRLGSLDDDLETIQQRYKELILNTMPALKDEKCMSCPVLGFCWGGCISGNSFVHDQPSKYCNQEGLIAEVKKVYDY